MKRKERPVSEKSTRSGFFLVREEILPEAIKKTIRVKEALKKGEAPTINEAVAMKNLSRSAYYKYKDYVFPFYEATRNKLITFGLILENKPGVLAAALTLIGSENGNVMMINQGMPQQGIANATVTVETVALNISVEDLLEKLRAASGVKSAEIVGQGD